VILIAAVVAIPAAYSQVRAYRLSKRLGIEAWLDKDPSGLTSSLVVLSGYVRNTESTSVEVRVALVIDGALRRDKHQARLAANAVETRFSLNVPSGSWRAFQSRTGTVSMRVAFGPRRVYLWRGGRGPAFASRTITLAPGERKFS
jgi:hypothetical protein